MFSDSVVLSSVMLTPYAGTFNFSFLNVLKVAINHSSSCLIQKLLETSVIIEFEANTSIASCLLTFDSSLLSLELNTPLLDAPDLIWLTSSN